jgi:hypothetical protein
MAKRATQFEGFTRLIDTSKQTATANNSNLLLRINVHLVELVQVQHQTVVFHAHGRVPTTSDAQTKLPDASSSKGNNCLNILFVLSNANGGRGLDKIRGEEEKKKKKKKKRKRRRKNLDSVNVPRAVPSRIKVRLESLAFWKQQALWVR